MTGTTDDGPPFLSVDQAVALHEGLKRTALAVPVDFPLFGSSLGLQLMPRPVSLPACPDCGTSPSEVSQRTSAAFNGLDVAYLPCGHEFRIGGAAMSAIYELEMRPTAVERRWMGKRFGRLDPGESL